MSYAIPTNELTLTDIKTYKERCLAAGIARAKAKGIAASDEELVWREMYPAFDLGALGVLAANGWVLDYYVTPAGAPIPPAWGTVYGLAAARPDPTMPVGRVGVFYKVYDADPAGATATAVRFMIAAATTKASFFIQELLDAKLEPEAWFSEPIVYDPNDIVNIDWYSRAVAGAPVGGEELGFGCFIIERVGAVVS